MTDPTEPTAFGDDTTTLLRYADPDRPPSRWVYVAAGVVLGGAVALMGILPVPWGVGMVALAAAAGLGVDAWLARRHGVPPLRQLPVSVRREQVVLIVGAGVVAVVLPMLAGLFDGSSTRAAFILAGVVFAVGFGLGGPIVEWRARDRARELLR